MRVRTHRDYGVFVILKESSVRPAADRRPLETRTLHGILRATVYLGFGSDVLHGESYLRGTMWSGVSSELDI